MARLAERLAKFDFQNMDINHYNVLLELICLYSPSDCATLINERIVDEKQKQFLIGELRRFYQVGESLKNKGKE